MAREVWFVLMNPSGSVLVPAAFVNVPDRACVADVRHAVNDACSNRLASVDALQLTVYVNRAAFAAETPPLAPAALLAPD